MPPAEPHPPPPADSAATLPTDPEEIGRGLSDYDPATLVALVRRANRYYWDENSPRLPDALYDRLLSALRRLDPHAAVLNEFGPTVRSGTVEAELDLELEAVRRRPPQDRLGVAVRHRHSMLSLDKCYEPGALLEWAEKFRGGIVVMPKIDGVACSLRYGRDGCLLLAATRGSGTIGEDITINALQIDDIPKKLAIERVGELEVRGEIFMQLSVFRRFSDAYANPRNLSAGAIKNKNAAKSRDYALSFLAYDVLDSGLQDERQKCALLGQLGFAKSHFSFVAREEMQSAFESIAASRSDLDYEIDGVVFRAELVAEQERLGATGHHPRWSIAYKFQGDTGETTLHDVQWSISRTGTITPVALLEPVELSGAVLRRASLHNLSRFEALRLSYGATVAVTRRGGVIPMVERVLSPGPEKRPFPLPTACPGCGGAVERRKKREGEFLYCVDPQRCANARLGELKHFAKVVGMLGFGPKVLANAVDKGLLAHPDDFFGLAVEDLEGLARLGRRSAQNLIDEIAARREIPLPVFLQSLGIDHLGQHNANLLARMFGSLDRLRALRPDELVEVKGFADAIAEAIVDGFRAKRQLIDRLLGHVRVPDLPVSRAAGGAETGGAETGKIDPAPWAGKKFLFTGALEGFSRLDAQAKVEALGGSAVSGVSRKLNYLVLGAGKGAVSSKQKKAELLIGEGAAIQIINEARFLAMMDESWG